MKKKLIMFITGMLLTASLLMGCAGETSIDANVSDESIFDKDTEAGTDEDKATGTDEDKDDDENKDKKENNDDTEIDDGSLGQDSFAKVESGNYPRLIQYIECKTYDKFHEMLIEDTVDGLPVLTNSEQIGSSVYNTYLMYEEYQSLTIDGIVYDRVVVNYNMSTNEIIQFGVTSENTTVESCIAFEKFVLDYFGKDSNVYDDFDENLEPMFMYGYTWYRDDDITIRAAATDFDGIHQYSVAIGVDEY